MQAEDRERRRRKRRAAVDEALLAADSLDDNESEVKQSSLSVEFKSEGENGELASNESSMSSACESGGGPMCEPAVLQSYTAVVTTFNSHCR